MLQAVQQVRVRQVLLESKLRFWNLLKAKAAQVWSLLSVQDVTKPQLWPEG